MKRQLTIIKEHPVAYWFALCWIAFYLPLAVAAFLAEYLFAPVMRLLRGFVRWLGVERAERKILGWMTDKEKDEMRRLVMGEE